VTGLLSLRSVVAEQVIAYLRAVDAALAESPVIGSFQKQHSEAGFDLRLDGVRVDLKAEIYDADLARSEAMEGEALRPFWRLPRTDRQSRNNNRPQPLTRLLAADAPRAVRHALILGNPGSGKSEALKHQVRLCASQSRTALEEFTILPGMVPLPVYLRGVRLAEKLGDVSSLDRCIAEFPIAVRPRHIGESDWRTSLRCAAAILLTVQGEDAFAAAAEPPAAGTLWQALTLAADHTAMSLIAIDSWDETPPVMQMRLRNSLRPFARGMAARVFVASRLASYAAQDNPLFDAMTQPGRQPEQQEVRLRELDPLDIRHFIDLFFGIACPEGESEKVDDPGIAARRAIGEQLKQALARAPHLTGVIDNPLMATLLCHDFWFDQQHERKGLPHSRGDLFGRILRRMIGKWRRLRTGQAAADWAPWDDVDSKAEQMLDLLAAIAESFFPGELLPARELADFLYRDVADPTHQGYIRKLDPADPLKRHVASLPGSLADDLCADGVLMEVVGATGRGFGFLHRQFMEFLVAYAWARRINPPRDNLGNPLGTDNWGAMADQIDRLAWSRAHQEPLILLAGLLADPMPLLNLLTAPQADDVLHHRAVVAALALPEIGHSAHKRLCKLIAEITTIIVEGTQAEAKAIDDDPRHFRDALGCVAVVDGEYAGEPLLQWLARVIPNAAIIPLTNQIYMW
jgi:hypothetical protein